MRLRAVAGKGLVILGGGGGRNVYVECGGQRQPGGYRIERIYRAKLELLGLDLMQTGLNCVDDCIKIPITL